MKKIILAVILFSLCFLMPVQAQNAEVETFTSGDWTYIENNNGITLTAYNGEPAESMELPAELDGKPVTQTGPDLFKNDTVLKSVTIPEGITTVGRNAFNGCTSLTEVILPNTLTRIDANAFQYCIALEAIDIPFSVTTINASAFADCISLKEAVLLSVTTIGDSAFDNCVSLEKVTVSRKVTNVGAFAFRDTPWLEAQSGEEFVMMGKGVLIGWNGSGTEVEVPYGTTMIAGAFADCAQLEKVTIPETVTQIGSSSFRDAINLREVNIPQYVTTIGGNAFDGCRSLSSIVLPDHLKTIGGAAFRYCENLREVVIPETVTSLPGNAFAECLELTDVYIPDTVEKIAANTFLNAPKVNLHVVSGSFAESFAKENELPFEYEVKADGEFIYSIGEDGAKIVRYTGTLRDVEVPASVNGVPVTEISAGAFQNNSQVRRIIVPMTVKAIESWAFSYMDRLEAVQLPEGLIRLGSNIFTGCPALKEIRMPGTLSEIGAVPFDADTKTMICADPGSAAAEALEGSGYTTVPSDSCAPDEELMSLWAELNMIGVEVTENVCVNGETVRTAAPGIHVVRIPDGVASLNAELLSGFEGEVIVVIPASVREISEDILEGRTLTFVSVSGSAAEAFAAEHGVKFLLQARFLINM